MASFVCWVEFRSRAGTKPETSKIRDTTGRRLERQRLESTSVLLNVGSYRSRGAFIVWHFSRWKQGFPVCFLVVVLSLSRNPPVLIHGFCFQMLCERAGEGSLHAYIDSGHTP